mmetsp:Transcript_4889/g.14686  ORF Transcript_4889/g.14686 Transcript_4889/m.14686 type:complete len:139 (-) Transcript_4889:145-561(-)
MAAMDVDSATAVVGADAMAALPSVARRMNFKLFQQAETGAAIRIGGRLAAAGAGDARVLTTTDGGSLRVLAAAEPLPAEIAGGAFVEVVGTKAGADELRSAGILAMPGKEPMVDAELWDEAVRLSHLPQLREIFEPQL